MINSNNQLIFTIWCIPVAIFGAFLITIFGAYSFTDYNGKVLAKYMIEFQVGVSTKEVYTIKRLDTDYFEEF